MPTAPGSVIQLPDFTVFTPTYARNCDLQSDYAPRVARMTEWPKIEPRRVTPETR